jgi:hypothetical protein
MGDAVVFSGQTLHNDDVRMILMAAEESSLPEDWGRGGSA